MMSLRQRHIDPQLAMGSQRLVEGCLLAAGGTQGEASGSCSSNSSPPHPQSHQAHQAKPRASLLQNRSHSFGSCESTGQQQQQQLPSISHPSIICTSSSSSSLASLPPPLPLSFSSLASSMGRPHSLLFQSAYFQPVDTSPDFPPDNIPHARSRRSGSHGYTRPVPPRPAWLVPLMSAWHALGAFCFSVMYLWSRSCSAVPLPVTVTL